LQLASVSVLDIYCTSEEQQSPLYFCHLYHSLSPKISRGILIASSRIAVLELFPTGTNIVNQSEHNADRYITSTGTEQKSNQGYYKLTHYKSIRRYNGSVHNAKLQKNIKDLLVVR